MPIASDDVHTSEPPRRREEPHVSSAANDEIAAKSPGCSSRLDMHGNIAFKTRSFG